MTALLTNHDSSIKKLFIPLLGTIAAVIFFSPAFLLRSAATTEGESKALFEQKCSQCHSIDLPRSHRYTKDEWFSTVRLMKTYGCPITGEEGTIIAEYLAKEYGKQALRGRLPNLEKGTGEISGLGHREQCRVVFRL